MANPDVTSVSLANSFFYYIPLYNAIHYLHPILFFFYSSFTVPSRTIVNIPFSLIIGPIQFSFLFQFVFKSVCFLSLLPDLLHFSLYQYSLLSPFLPYQHYKSLNSVPSSLLEPVSQQLTVCSTHSISSISFSFQIYTAVI